MTDEISKNSDTVVKEHCCLDLRRYCLKTEHYFSISGPFPVLPSIPVNRGQTVLYLYFDNLTPFMTSSDDRLAFMIMNYLAAQDSDSIFKSGHSALRWGRSAPPDIL